MRLLARLVLGLAVILSTTAGVMVLTAGPAAACSCASQDVDDLSAGADVIFTGSVSKRAEYDDEAVLTVRVDQVFEGEVQRRTDVVGGVDGNMCGLDQREGDPIIVFGTLSDGEVSAGLCSSLHPLSGPGYEKALVDLGEGAEPSPGYMKAERRGIGLSYDQFVAGRAILGVLGLLGLAYLGYRTWRVRRRTS